MSQGPRTDKRVLKMIADQAVRNPKEPRQDLYARLKQMIADAGYPPLAEETILRHISTARRTIPKFEQDWTMASLRDKDNYLPPEAIPAVLKVWRYAINTGEKFTLAQAEWAARLHAMYPDTPLLWFWSYQYAHEERLATVTDQDMDSFLLDSNLILTPWERDTLLHTDFRDKALKFRAERFLPLDDDGHVIEELLHGNLPPNPWDDAYFQERNLTLSDIIRELPSVDTLGFTDEAKMVYLRWFTYLTKGPNWDKLPAKHALNIIKSLRKIIKREQSHRRKSQEALDSQPRDFYAYMDVQEDSASFYSKMRPLLQRVGYQTEPKEDKDEGPRH
jgi:hypothetical protein